jgi:hypothetical protein
MEKTCWAQEFLRFLYKMDARLRPALDPKRARAALAQPSKILPEVRFIQRNSIQEIRAKWNKVL